MIIDVVSIWGLGPKLRVPWKMKKMEPLIMSTFNRNMMPYSGWKPHMQNVAYRFRIKGMSRNY